MKEDRAKHEAILAARRAKMEAEEAAEAARKAAVAATVADLPEDWDAPSTPVVKAPKPLRYAQTKRVEVAPPAKPAPAKKGKVHKKTIVTRKPGFIVDPVKNPKGLTDDDIADFKALGVAVKLVGPAGDVWIVPRKPVAGIREDGAVEISIEHARTLALINLAFEGAVVASVEPCVPDELDTTDIGSDSAPEPEGDDELGDLL